MKILQLQSLTQHTCEYLLTLTTTTRKQHKNYENSVYVAQQEASQSAEYKRLQQEIITTQFCEYAHTHRTITQYSGEVMQLSGPLTQAQSEVYKQFEQMVHIETQELLPSASAAIYLEYGSVDIQLARQAAQEQSLIRQAYASDNRSAAQAIAQLQRLRNTFYGGQEEKAQRELEILTLRKTPPLFSMYASDVHIILNLSKYLKHEISEYAHMCQEDMHITQFLHHDINTTIISKRAYIAIFENYYNNTRSMYRATHSYFLLSPLRMLTILKYLDNHIDLCTQQQQILQSILVAKHIEIPIHGSVSYGELRQALLSDYAQLLYNSIDAHNTIYNTSCTTLSSLEHTYTTYEDIPFIALFIVGIHALRSTEDTQVQDTINEFHNRLSKHCYGGALVLRSLDMHMRSTQVTNILENSGSQLAMLMFSHATLIRLTVLHLCTLRSIGM